jgi:sugar/nucleoside kinase (ribokinase family)
LPYLDLMVVNDHEIGAVAGEPTVTAQGTDVEACIRAMRTVLGQGSLKMVAVHFPKGGLALERGGELVRQPSLRVPKEEIVGANGAGDAFAAGFLYGFHEGWAAAECLALAHASAGASLRGISTTGTVEPWQTCLSLARQWGPREAI